MRVVRLANALGIDDIKLIAEDEADRVFIQQLAEAGTLSSMNVTASSTVIFRAMSVLSNSQAQNYNLISRGAIGKLDFTVRQNQGFSLNMDFVKDGAPMDLSEYTVIKLQVKPSKSSSAIIDLALGTGLGVSGTNNETLRIDMEETQTIHLCNDSYYYDILFSNTEDKVYYVEGKINVLKSVTR